MPPLTEKQIQEMDSVLSDDQVSEMDKVVNNTQDQMPQGHISNTDPQVTKEGYYLTPEQINELKDVYNQISTTPNRMLRFIEEPVSNAIVNGVSSLTGIKPKHTQQEVSNAMYPQAQTDVGKIARSGSDIASTFILPEAKVFKGTSFLPKLGNSALTGGYQGAAIGAMDNLEEGKFDPANIGISAGIGAGIGSFLPALGKGFEKSMPHVGSFMASIPKESSQIALNAINRGENFFAGKFDKIKSFYPITEKIRNAIAEKIPNKDYYTQQYKKIGQQAENFADKYIMPDENFNILYKGLGSRIFKGLDYIEGEYGKAIAEIERSLKSKSNLIDISDIYNNFLQKVNSMKGNKESKLIEGSTEDRIINEYLRKLKDYTTQRIESKTSSIMDNYGNPIIYDTPKEMGINPIDLHYLKDNLWKVIYENKGRGLTNDGELLLSDLGNNINSILREDPNYAHHMDMYSGVMDAKQNIPGLKENLIGSKLANLRSDANQLSGLKEKLSKINDVLPEDYRFMEDLNTALNMQHSQEAFKSNLSPSIFNDISKYDNAPLDVQAAFEKLNQNSPNNFIEKYKKLAEQQSELSELQNNLRPALIRNPRLIPNNQDELAVEAFNKLNDMASPENKFLDQNKDLMARQDFEKWLPGRGGGSGSEEGNKTFLRTLALTGSTATAPLLTPFVAASFLPKTYKYLLQGYQKGQPISSFLPRTITAGYNENK